MRKHRTLLRRLWRDAPPERIPIRVTWIDGETIYINGDKDDPPIKPTPPVVEAKPTSYNGDR